MTDTFRAVMSNDYFSHQKKHWRVTIEANNLNDLNNICSAINLIRNGKLEVDRND